MRITIDTATDHHDHIREVIRLLQSLLGKARSNYTDESLSNSSSPSPLSHLSSYESSYHSSDGDSYRRPATSNHEETSSKNIFESDTTTSPGLFAMFDTERKAKSPSTSSITSQPARSSTSSFSSSTSRPSSQSSTSSLHSSSSTSPSYSSSQSSYASFFDVPTKTDKKNPWGSSSSQSSQQSQQSSKKKDDDDDFFSLDLETY